MKVRGDLAKGVAIAVGVAAAWALPTPSVLADVEAGIKAYDSGNFTQALGEFEKSADVPEAQYYLGLMHESGKGALKNYSLAWGWLIRAAGGNHTAAQVKVAEMLENGIGVPSDIRKASKWYERAAKNGDSSAQARLGGMLIEGYGVKRDLYQGTAWLERAAEGGNSAAQAKLDQLFRRGFLTREQVLFGITNEGKPPPPLSEKGAAIRKDLDRVLKSVWSRLAFLRSKDQRPSMRVGGDPVAYERDGAVVLILPSVQMSHADGRTTNLGTVRIRAIPEGEDFYRVRIGLSGRIATVTKRGIQTDTLTFEELQVTSLWSKKLNDLAEMEVKGLKVRSHAIGNEIVEVGQLVLSQKFSEKKPGEWGGALLVRATDIRASSGRPAESTTIGKITIRGEVEGFRLEAFRKFQKDLGIDVTTWKWSDPNTLAQGLNIPDEFPLFGKFSWIEFALENLVITENQGQRAELANGFLALAARDLEAEHGQLELKFGYKGLVIVDTDGPEVSTPNTLAYDSVVNRFPAQRILLAVYGTGIRNMAGMMFMLSQGEIPTQRNLNKMAGKTTGAIETALFDAKTEYVIRDMIVQVPDVKIEVRGNLEADRQSVRKVFGSFTVAVTNFDKLANNPELLPVSEDNPEKINFLREVGEKKTGSDGSDMTLFRIDITREGPILINGKDAAKLMGDIKVH